MYYVFMAAFALALAAHQQLVAYVDTPNYGQSPYYQSTQTDTDLDYQVAKQVRLALTADYTLSTLAKNIVIDAHKGVVTLTGAVESYGEKQNVESKASSVAGVNKVIDRLQVSNPH